MNLIPDIEFGSISYGIIIILLDTTVGVIIGYFHSKIPKTYQKVIFYFGIILFLILLGSIILIGSAPGN